MSKETPFRKSFFTDVKEDPVRTAQKKVLDASIGNQAEVARDLEGLPRGASVCVVDGVIVKPINTDGPKSWAV